MPRWVAASAITFPASMRASWVATEIRQSETTLLLVAVSKTSSVLATARSLAGRETLSKEVGPPSVAVWAIWSAAPKRSWPAALTTRPVALPLSWVAVISIRQAAPVRRLVVVDRTPRALMHPQFPADGGIWLQAVPARLAVARTIRSIPARR